MLDVEQDRRFIPSFISGERVIFLATGSVDGFVNFNAVGPERVVVDEVARTATISLPSPQLGAPVVDHEASRVLSRDRGIAERVGSVFEENPGSETEFFQLAERRLAEAAAQSDVRNRWGRGEHPQHARVAGQVAGLHLGHRHVRAAPAGALPPAVGDPGTGTKNRWTPAPAGASTG